MRLMVTGAGGLLGTELAQVARDRGGEVVALERRDLDVTDEAAVQRAVRDTRPSWVAHCAAYTAVDRAEDDAGQAMRVNRDGTRYVARAVERHGGRMLYLSTDYVFDGVSTAPYPVDATPSPLSVYGRTKLAGERAALAAGPEAGALVVRTGWLYGAHGRNFVRTVARRVARGEALRVVDDQRGRPTWTRNLAHTLMDLMESGVRGVWHVADGGDATWYDLAREVVEGLSRLPWFVAAHPGGVPGTVEPTSTMAWGAAAPRPACSVLDLSGTERRLQRASEPWRESLDRFLHGIERTDIE